MPQLPQTLAAAAAAAALALAGAPAARAQDGVLLSIDDPQGDDVGAGNLIYPRDNVYVQGDLDLRSLRVRTDPAGLRFDATFRNPIRDPAQVKGTGLGSEDLSVFARRGFYAFNLDLYFDTDRASGSGNTISLPGRGARFDPAHAWDKVVVLTPRPELMRRQLADALTETTPGAGADAAIDASVFFATDVRVRGRTVSFTVPSSFLDPSLVPGASVTALVTAAKLSIEADLSFFGKPAGRPIDRLALGAVQPEAGYPAQTLGYGNGQAPATAVVDLLSPAAAQQRAELSGGILSGLNRDNRYGAAAVAATTAAAPAAGATPAAEAPTSPSWFSRALGAVSGLFGGASDTAAAPAATGPAPSLQSLIEPAPPAGPAPAAATAPAPAATPAPARAPLAAPSPAGAPAPAPTTAPMPAAAAPSTPAAATAPVTTPATPGAAPVAVPVPRVAPAAPAPAAVAAPRTAPAAPAASAPRTARDAAFYEEQETRLRALRRLRDGGLITEEEYQRKRREVIDAL